MRNINHIDRLWFSSTVVKYLTHNPKIKGLKPATGNMRENYKTGWQVVIQQLLNPKIEGSDPGTDTVQENYEKY